MESDRPQRDEVQEAFDNFTDFMLDLIQFTMSAYGGVRVANQLHNLGRQLGVHRLLARDTADQDQMLQGFLLLAAWGAFEAFFEDFCKAVIARESTVNDIHDKYRKILNKSKDRDALNKFEAILHPLDRRRHA
jgi:hypothetical protein